MRWERAIARNPAGGIGRPSRGNQSIYVVRFCLKFGRCAPPLKRTINPHFPNDFEKEVTSWADTVVVHKVGGVLCQPRASIRALIYAG